MKRLTREKQMSRTVILLAASLIFPRASFGGENYRIEPGQSAVNFWGEAHGSYHGAWEIYRFLRQPGTGR